MNRPACSIVIRVFNEARHLPALFARLAAQRERDFEIIVVDSGSVDGSREIAAAEGARVIRIDPHHFTFGYALNVGIEAATGHKIAIVSAHTLPIDSDWLGALMRPFADEKVAMVYGRQVGVPESKFSEFQDFKRTFGERRERIRPPNFFANNANSAIRRDLWREVPFDIALPGLEDAAWAKVWMNRGYDVAYEPDAALYHIHQESWPQVRRRYYREAVAARRLGLKGRRSTPAVVASELLYAMSDAVRALSAAMQGQLARPLGDCLHEIARFRLAKTLGTVHGLIHGAKLDRQPRGSQIYFDKPYSAVVLEGPGRASVQMRDVREPKPGEVLVKVAYVGVCGTDLEMHNGTLGYFANGLATYPIVPGHEVSGTIAAIGVGVARCAEGDSVVIECIQSCQVCDACRARNWIACQDRRELGVLGLDGGYAEYVMVPARFVHVLPAGADLAKAALCEPLAVVIKGLDRLGRVYQGSARNRVAVIGGGALGRLSAIVLAQRGHSVTLIDRNPARVAGNLPQGIVGTSDIRAIADCDAFVEATGNHEALDKVLTLSRAGAAILLLGFPYASRDFNFESLVAYDKTVVGSVGSSSADFAEAVQLVGSLDLEGFVQSVVPLRQYDRAWEQFKTHASLKVLLQPE